MQRNVVRTLQQFVQADFFDAKLGSFFVAEVGVETEDGQAEALGLLHDGAADVAEADNAERLLGQASRWTAGDAAPFAVADVVMVRQQVAVQHQQKGEGVGADFVDAVVGHVGDRDTALAGSFQVDHVHADAVTRDDLAVGERVDHLPVDFRPLHQQRVRAVKLRDELLRRRRVQSYQFVVQPRSGQLGLVEVIFR